MRVRRCRHSVSVPDAREPRRANEGRADAAPAVLGRDGERVESASMAVVLQPPRADDRIRPRRDEAQAVVHPEPGVEPLRRRVVRAMGGEHPFRRRAHVRAVIAEVRKRSKILMRAHIEAIPDGTYRFSAFVDSDGITDDILEVALEARVDGSDLHFDYSRSSPPCRGPLNKGYGPGSRCSRNRETRADTGICGRNTEGLRCSIWWTRCTQMVAEAVDEVPRPHPGVIPVQPPVPDQSPGGAGRHVQRYAESAAGVTEMTEDATPEAAGPETPGAFSALSHLSNSANALEMVRQGLPFSTLESLVGVLGVPQKEVASIIGIPATTLSRRKKNGRLTQLESDRLMRIARLVEMVHRMMQGDAVAARRWLTAPHELLDGAKPLAHASTEVGGREVEQLIGRLRHGTFS